jgi:hypothetical protein
MIELGIAVNLLMLGYFVGNAVQIKHKRDLKKRELNLLAIPNRTDKGTRIEAGEPFFVGASVVVASDHFRTYMGKLWNAGGGRLNSQEELLDRGRREVLC